MDEKKPETAPLQIPIKADDSIQAGAFSNLARISHSADTFLIDFLVLHSDPPFGKLQARILLSPGHAKRLVRALGENIDRFERVHGEIRLAEPPAPGGYVQ
jgi:hypothetical protein